VCHTIPSSLCIVQLNGAYNSSSIPLSPWHTNCQVWKNYHHHFMVRPISSNNKRDAQLGRNVMHATFNYHHHHVFALKRFQISAKHPRAGFGAHPFKQI
jgi:hypothetical protein